MRLIGANPAPEVQGVDELPGKANYFRGNDPAKWRTQVPRYAKVRYTEVYPGIDLVHCGNQGQLEYDFVVAPGADPGVIRLAFDGLGGEGLAGSLRIDADGNLVVPIPGGEVVQHAPVIYQEIDGIRQPIAGRFVLHDRPVLVGSDPQSEIPNPQSEVGFALGAYDPTRPLVIDPALVYSTYLGGSGGDEASGIAVDGAGNAYVTGWTASADFPTANAFQATYRGRTCGDYWCSSDAFVAKLDAAGSALVYSTYLGGSGSDEANGIAVDGAGNAYVTGRTYSADFPTANALQGAKAGYSNAFVTKISASPFSCGDGIVDLGEECDLGAANGSSDCCCSWCRLRGSTHVCRPAGDCDAPETCSGSVECPADRKHFDGMPCDDCSGQCSAGVCISGGTPLSNCRTAEKSLLKMKKRTFDRRLLWRWKRGESTSLAELSDPESTATYTLCLYAGTTDAVLTSVVVPPSAESWSRISDRGYKFGTPKTTTKIRLKGSDRNKANALVKSRVWRHDLVLALPVTAQLVNSDTGLCLEAIYDSADVIKNEPDQFEAKTKQ